MKAAASPSGHDRLLTVYLLYVATIPVVRPGLLTIGGRPLLLADLFLTLTCLGWGVRLFRGKVALPHRGILVAALCYLAALAISLIGSTGNGLAGAAKLAAYSSFVALPVITPGIVKDERALQLTMKAWLVGLAFAVLIGLIGLVAFYVHRPTGMAMMCGYGGVKAGNYPRLCAPFRNQTMLCSYVTAATGLALATGHRLLSRAKLWILVGLAAVVAAFTLSAGFGGFALCAVGALVARRRQANQRWGILDKFLVAGAGLVATFFVFSMLATIQPPGGGNISLGSHDIAFPDGMRPSIWKGIVPNIKKHPLTGLGYGSMVSLTDDPRAFTPPDKIPFLPRPIKPQWLEGHNVWLSVFGQGGLLAFVCFTWLIIQIALRLRDARTDVGRSWAHDVLVGTAAAFLGAFVFQGMFNALEEARHIWALFGVITAASAVIVELSKERLPVRDQESLRSSSSLSSPSSR